MNTEQTDQLINLLLSRTRDGRLFWFPSVEENALTAVVEQDSVVIVRSDDHGPSKPDLPRWIDLVLFDRLGRETARYSAGSERSPSGGQPLSLEASKALGSLYEIASGRTDEPESVTTRLIANLSA